VEIVLWCKSEAGPVRARFPREEAVMFVPRATSLELGHAPFRREQRALFTLEGEDVDALYFRSQRALLDTRDRLRATLGVPLESDVKPQDRFVMERFITGGLTFRFAESSARTSQRAGQPVLELTDPKVRAEAIAPKLTTLSIDLETDGYDGPVIAASLASNDLGETGQVRRVLMTNGTRTNGTSAGRGGASTSELRFVADERALLAQLFSEIQALDPDLIVGWNVVEFDLMHLEKRANALGLPFAIGRLGERARILPGSRRNERAIARVPGRVVLDGIATLRSATFSFERYSLEFVGRALLGRGKKIAETSDPVAEIRRMHREDPLALAAYNLEDAVLALDIFTKADLIGFVTERARLTGLPMDRAGGSVAAFDHLYLPRLHRRGYVAPDVGVEVEAIESPGGHVLEPVPGLVRNVLSFDFRSLYPSLILTFGIDPLGLATAGEDAVVLEGGTRFSRKDAILPEIIEGLWQARARANASGNAALSRAIKIQMNSFYGVLGTPGCRFFDPRLPTAITRRGHAIIERARRFFEDEKKLPVRYGDTDSLFVEIDPQLDTAASCALGRALSAELNGLLAAEIAESHGVTSRLELRFDALYERFLLPTMRGSERGSKKRYAGLVRRESGGSELVIRGLEAVRTDWTPLARRIQRELFEKVFSDQPVAAWLQKVREALLRGELDEELIYRKRLRQSASEYVAAPPHVRAAQQLEEEEGFEVDEIRYFMTVRGPEPVSMKKSAIDYAHYLEKQLAPACDVVLPFLGTDFMRIAGQQMSLF
jgi:DNA polymerase II